nr:MAG TPA: Concanavalin A-like lectin/glucanase superfamily protein [Caudoviricetes sp.]
MGHSDVNGFANSVQTYDGTNWHKVKLNLEANKWYHLAYGNDGEKTVVYVNGEQKIVRN